MKSYKKILIIIPLLLSALLAVAQVEDCSNGLDDDGDGFIDCYDSDCSGNAQCLEFYFGNAVICQDPATESPAFSTRLQWASDDRTAFNSVTPAIGDLDGDGIPEVISTNREDDTMTILDGATGNTKFGPLDVQFDIAKTVAIANLDDDECGEIFIRGFRNKNLRMYDCQLNEIWDVDTNTGGKVGIISLADFNGDGIVELLHGNEIRNAHTGEVIIAGTGDFETDVTHATIAIDILPESDGLEIVDGGKIYTVDIPTQTDKNATNTGVRTLVRDVNDIITDPDSKYAIKYQNWNFNSSAVADYNQDGSIDVIFSGGQYVDGTLTTTAFFWDVANSNVITFNVPQNHKHGTGRINVADIDGDGNLNCTFVSKQRLYALDENMEQLWFKDVNEGSSGFTGCTVFDFNDDKAAEIIYRGENYIHIIDGKTSTSLQQIKCTSRTFEEYPIVADVDGDGASEICVACSTDDNTPFEPYSNGRFGQIRVFEADGGESWQPSRPIWNQHSYFNVNINDDLTIPIAQQDPTKIFSSNVCTTGDNRPLNAFLNQAPYLNEFGCPSLVSPDIELVEVINIGNAQCPEVNFNVSTVIKNTGDIALTGLLPITFYNGSPSEPSSVKLNTFITTVSNFDVDETMTITGEVVGKGGDFDLYVSVNDDGSQNPPITSFSRPIPECEDDNNLTFRSVTALDFDLQHEVISDNENCDATKPSNGDARVFYFGTISKTVEELWDEDFEDLANGTTEDTGTTAWSFTHDPADADPDRIEVSFIGSTNKVIFDNTDGVVQWESQLIDISGYELADISIDLLSSATTDDADDFFRVYYVVDGGVEQSLTDGLHVGNFGSITATAEDIVGSSLKIIVRAQNDQEDEFYYIDNILINGVTDEQTGEITSGFSFYWFQNNNFVDTLFTGSRYSALDDGIYQVVGASQTNSCVSNVEEVTIEKIEVLPEVVIEKTQDLTLCNTPNGILTAYVVEDGIQVEDGYDFVWYLGSDFTVVQATGHQASGLQATTYSVVVTNEISGCETTASESVDTSVPRPELEQVSITNITDCTDPNSGVIEVNVVDENNSDFSFLWYSGSVIKALPDETSGATRAGVDAGFHTVRAVNTTTGCISDPLTLFVDDLSDSPELVMTLTANASCTDDGSGTATAEISGSSIDDYSFVYYSGSNALPANEIFTTSGTNGEVAQLLTSGQYLVTAENNITGCVGRAYFTIEDAIVNPELPPSFTIDIVNETTCSGIGQGDGIIDASGLGLDDVSETDEFESIENGGFEVPDIEAVFGRTTFQIFDQTLADGWSSTDGVLEYWRDGFSAGSGGPVPAPEGNQFAEINANNVGAFFFDVVTKPGIRMEWSFFHRGRAGEDVMALKIDDPSVPQAAALQIGEFTTGNTAWATYSGQYIVPDGQTLTRFSFEAVSTASSSNSVGNFIDNVVFEVAPYYYELYAGSNSSGSPLEENTSGIFDDLAEGQYTISVKNNVTGCPTDDITVNVLAADSEPIIVRQTKTADDFCIGGGGTQRVTATTSGLVGEPTNNGYEFSIFNGTDVTATPYAGPFVDADGDYTFEGLEDDTYRILVTNLDRNCSNTTDITIIDDSENPSFASPIISPQSNCTGDPNGYVIINIFGSLPKEDYTWSWLDPAGDPIPDKTNVDASIVGNDDANFLDGYAAGIYQVNAMNTLTKCETGFLNVVIPYVPNYPVIELSELAVNTGCTLGNGSLGAIAKDGSSLEVTIGYTFEWFLGNDDSGTVLTNGDDAGNGSDVLLEADADGVLSIISGLNAPSGMATYTVRVTHDDTGCSNTSTITLTDNTINPVVTNGVPTDNTACDGGTYDGTITASISYDGSNIGLPNADYEFAWHTGTDTTSARLTETSHILSSAQDGDYTVYVINATTGCSSGLQTYTISPSLEVFDIVIDPSATPNTNCTGTPNGQLAATIEIGAVDQDETDYTFVWYEGDDDTTPISAPATSVDNVASSLEAGEYTVAVTSNITNCTYFSTVDLEDAVVNYDNVTATPAASTECASNNGSITVSAVEIRINGITTNFNTVADVNANFTIELLDDALVSLGNINADGTDLLDVGDYYIQLAYGTTTGCLSAPIPVEIEDASVTPDIEITELAADEACDGGTPTGSLTAVIDESDEGGSATETADYTFQWYEGSDMNILTNPVADANGGNTATIANVAGGDYFVIVIDGAADYLGCTARTNFTLTEDNPTYTVQSGTETHVTDCTVKNTGEFTVTAISGTPAAVVGDFTYQFYNNGGTEILIGITDETITGLIPGDYSVVATHTTTNCLSVTFPFEIEDNSASPNLGIVTVNNTACGTGTPNGTITVTPDPADLAGPDYSYEWHEGTDLSDTSADPVVGTNSPILSGIDAGDYWVLVTDILGDNNTCTAKTSGSIIDDPQELSIVNYTTVPSDQCNPQNGSITIDEINIEGTTTTTDDDMIPYTFSLYESDGTTEIAGAFTQATASSLPIASDLDAATYFAAFENALSCESGLTEITIGSTAGVPTAAISELQKDQTCDGAANPNGQLYVDAGAAGNGDEADFSYQWYAGSNLTTPLVDGANTNGANIPAGEVTSATITGLSYGDYTVVVTDGVGSGIGCTTQLTFTLTQDAPTYEISASTTTHVVSCDNDDTGVFEVTVIDKNSGTLEAVANYSFEFFDNLGDQLVDGVDGITITGTNGQTISGLTPENYSVVVTNDIDKCSSAYLPFEILDNATSPSLSIATTDNSSCDASAPNGQLVVTPTPPDGGGEYTYEWYEGSDLSDTSLDPVVVGATSATLSSVDAGDYWVLVTDAAGDNITCSAKIGGSIVDDPVDIVIALGDITPGNVDDCNPDNGSIRIDQLIDDAVTISTIAGLDDYEFTLYESDGTTLSTSTFDNAGATTLPIVTGLSNGTYFVRANQDAATDCVSPLLEVVITDIATLPVIATTETSASAQCDGATVQDGAATVTITGEDGNETITWYEGNDLNSTTDAVAPANISIDGKTISGVAAGFYWVSVTDGSTAGIGCESKAVVEITDGKPVLTIGAGDLSAVTNDNSCTADVGGITVNQINVVSGASSTDVNDYDFTWYNNDDTEIAGGITAASRFDLGAGNYYVIATHKTSKCITASAPFSITDVSEGPSLVAPSTTSTSCDIDNFPNGTLTVTPTLAGYLGTYTYQWYEGTIVTPGPEVPDAQGGDTDEISGQKPNNYHVVVTKDDGTGCSSTIQTFIDQDTDPAPTVGIVNSVQVNTCTPADGEIEATVGSGNAADYNFYWFDDETGTNAIIPTTSDVASVQTAQNLTEGFYSVYIENKTTGCTSDLMTVEVERDPASEINIVIFETQPGDCSGPTGELRIEATAPAGTTFVFNLYEGEGDLDDPVTGLIATSGALAVGNGADDSDFLTDFIVPGLINNTYTVVATNQTTGCTDRLTHVLFWADVQRVDVDPIVKTQALNCMPYADGSGNGGQGGNTGSADIILRIPSANPGTQDQYQIFLYQGTTALPSPDMLTGTGNWSTADGRDPIIQSKEGTLSGQTIEGGTGDKLRTYNFSGLTAGTYAVIAAQEGISFCYSPPITFEILDETDDIVASAVTVNDNVNCAVTPSGNITITEITRGADTDAEADLTSEYDFAWFNDDTNTPIGGNTNSITDLEAASYRVEVTKKQGSDNNEEACTETFYYDIFNEVPSHFIVDTDLTDVTDCATEDNGTITLNTVDVGSGTEAFVGVIAGYDFRLYDDTNTDINPDNDVATVTGLSAGVYQAVLYNEATECESAPIEITIGTDHTYPDITTIAAIETDNSGCDGTFDGQNGFITIDFNSVAATNYDIIWYEGELPSGTTVASNEVGNTSTISNLSGGTYTVSVIDNANPDNGCAVIGTYTIEDVIDAINTVNITPTDASNCEDPDNGSVIVNSIVLSATGTINDADAAMDDDYDFILYDNTFTQIGAISDVNEFNALNPGEYYIVVQGEVSGCQSDPVLFEIDDISETPSLSFNGITTNSNCDATGFSGGATVNAIDGSGVYNYTWYRGLLNDTSDPLAGEGAPVTGTGTATVGGLEEGQYWVSVTDAAVSPAAYASCASAAEVTINFEPQTISIDIADVDITPAVDCSGLNQTGEIDVTDVIVNASTAVTDGDFGDYDFFFYDDANNLAFSTGSTYINVAPGDYTIVAENRTTGCTTGSLEVTVGTVTDSPDIILTPTVNTACDGGAYDGTITLNITDLGVRTALTDYTINWYNGEQPVTPANFRENNTLTITGLESGFYTVVVTANVTPGIGCSSTATIEVVDDIETFEITSITPTDLNDCIVDGAAQVDGMNIGGVVTSTEGDIDDYTFTLYDENLANAVVFANAGTAVAYPSTATNLAAGTYFVIATDQAGLNCESAPVQFEIDDTSVKPELSIAQDTPNSTCDPATGTDNYNGSMTVSILNDDAGTYDYVWYRGELNDTSDPVDGEVGVVGALTASVTGLQEGKYWVYVQDVDGAAGGNLCDASAAYELLSDYSIISFAIADIDITEATDCTVPNNTGTIDVTDILLEGVSEVTSGNFADYEFEFFDDANVSITTVNPYVNVEPGDYFIVATNTVTGCTSASIQVTVDEIQATPTIAFAGMAPNTSCDATSYNGTITVNASGASTYSYQWYVGDQTSTTMVPNANGGNTATIFDVEDGEYSVEVTVLTATGEGVSCSVIGSSNISIDLPEVTVVNTITTDSNDCNPDENGSITVNQLSADGGVTFITTEADIALYTFELFDEDFATLGAFTNPGSGAVGDFPSTGALTAGDYYVVATNATLCSSPSVLVIIDDVSSNPDLVFDDKFANTSCNDTNPTGSMSLEITGGAIADYTIIWYKGDASTIGTVSEELVPAGNISIVGNKSVISNVTDGEYSVSVVDNTNPGTNCKTIGSSNINSEPLEVIITSVDEQINFNCLAPYDGSIEGLTVSVDGIILDAAATAASYTFTYFDEDLNALVDETALNEGSYYIVATHITEGCTSEPYLASVIDDIDNLTLVFSANSDNTLCTGANGSVTATVQYSGADLDGRFTLDWYQGGEVGTNAVSAGNITSGATDNISTISNMESDNYVVVATDNTTGCSITAYHDIDETLIIPELTIPDEDIIDLTHCTVDDGTITLTDTDVTGSLADYNITWFDSDMNPIAAFDNTTSQTTLSDDIYFIQIEHATTFCESALVQAVVEDRRETPTIIVDQVVNDIGCDGNTLGEGEINVTIGYSEIDGVTKSDPVGGFNFTWIETTGSTTVSGPGTSGSDAEDLKNQVGNVTYSITAFDGTTNCSATLEREIGTTPTFPSILDITVTDQMTCNDDGEIEINTVEFNGVEESVSDFTFDWGTTDGGDDLGDDLDGAASGAILSSLDSGYYYVSATHKLAGCSSNSLRIRVNSNAVTPSIEFTLNQEDQFCTGGNGILTVATDASTPTYLWSNLETTATISDLDAGSYEVTITDGVTGCTITDTYVVPFIEDPIMIDVNTEIVLTPATNCGALANGSIEITNITPNTVTDYTYLLHTGTYVSGSGVDMGNSGLFENLASDTYYIEAVNGISGCTSGVFELFIEDESIYPTIDLVSFALQSNCDPSNPNGLLSVGVNEGLGVINTSIIDYTFDWSASGGPANDPTFSDLTAGFYDITVTSTATGCSTDETYGMADDPNNPLLLNVSTNGNESCMDPNGELAISVINSVNETPEFLYYLYDGDVPSASGDTENLLPNNFAQDLDAGFYTILVIDDDSKCASDPLLVEIDDDNNTPSMAMSLVEDHPLTKCDLTKADGQATVTSIPEEPSRYTFYWYEGEFASIDLLDPTALIDSTLTVYQLVDQTYTVHMEDRITGCGILDYITISSEIEPVPLPELTLINDRTNCVTPNGAISATVNESLEGYTFEWVDSDDNVLSTTSSVSGLDIGTYGVIATDINSGCQSEKVEMSIADDRQQPFFRVNVTESTCDSEDTDGSGAYAGNGTADLEFVNPVTTDEVFWTFDTGSEIDTTDVSSIFSNNERLSGLRPNTYRVLVVDDNSCTYEQTFEVTTDIKIFNGVSDNGDSMNDYFRITCANQFPNNSIKIYNRSGTLVYETRSYEDNVSGKVFTGKSNTGIGGGSNGLPEGTYFYIFDKGEGSSDDVYQGYLELVR